jgi:hypothetical protein
MAEQKSAKPKGSPRSASKKGKKLSGFYYKIIMERAQTRKMARLKKREANFAKRRDARLAAKLAGVSKRKKVAGDQVVNA